MSTEISVGPALDVGVAIKCGRKAEFYESGRCSACDQSYAWSPSTNADAAFEAAAMVGLFKNGIVLFCHDGTWHVSASPYVGHAIGSGATPAEAICRAILKMGDAQ